MSLLLVVGGCAARAPHPSGPETPAEPAPLTLPRIGFSIQAGAFADPENAIRLRDALEAHGLEAFCFTGDDGLERVRFGSFADREEAVGRAETLRAEGVIEEYYAVPPELRGGADLRRRIARSALGFLGRPYRWGGPSPETGFDCSGLTMAAYRLNGVALPRTSRDQYSAGAPVRRGHLREADLVFFAMESRRKPTHVGLYVGEDRFVHAPSSGKVVRIDTLASSYYGPRFLAGRSYIP